MGHVITVVSTDAGWSVRGDTFEPLMFWSGARAEAFARRLAEDLRLAGHDVRLHIHLADGSLAGAFHYAPARELSLAD